MSRRLRSPIERYADELMQDRWDNGEIACEMDGCPNTATRTQEVDTNGIWRTFYLRDECEF